MGPADNDSISQEFHKRDLQKRGFSVAAAHCIAAASQPPVKWAGGSRVPGSAVKTQSLPPPTTIFSFSF